MYRRFGKRTLDITGSMLLIVLLLPLFVVVAIAVRFTSQGPIFFFQKRLTQGSTVFWIIKFRTLVDKPREASIDHPTSDELTLIGGFLRRWCLDELPQLWNVLIGNMSLIGPRPWALNIAEEARQRFDPDDCRYAVKTGMIGLARVHRRGRPLSWDEYQTDIEHDIDYGKRYSFWLDCWIVAQVFSLLFSRENTATK